MNQKYIEIAIWNCAKYKYKIYFNDTIVLKYQSTL